MADAAITTASFLNINKPQGITSHDVVSRVRRLTGIKQVGHAGTLDPMATGVMVVALGKACRLLRFLADDKSDKATIRLGVTTDTDDIEGTVLAENQSATTNPPAQGVIESALDGFVGDIEQIPPYYSAIHVDGKRLYEMARAGQAPPEIKARPVTIASIDLLSYKAPELTIRVHCSKGTYIRSIARDLGEKLGVGGTLSGLVRESAGRFLIEQASTLEDLAGDGELLQNKLVTIDQAVDLTKVAVSETLARRLVMGQKIARADLDPISAAPQLDLAPDGEHTYLLVTTDRGKPFCIGRVGQSEIDSQIFIAPEVVFADV